MLLLSWCMSFRYLFFITLAQQNRHRGGDEWGSVWLENGTVLHFCRKPCNEGEAERADGLGWGLMEKAPQGVLKDKWELEPVLLRCGEQDKPPDIQRSWAWVLKSRWPCRRQLPYVDLWRAENLKNFCQPCLQYLRNEFSTPQEGVCIIYDGAQKECCHCVCVCGTNSSKKSSP